MSCALDGYGHGPLMLSAVAGDSAGENFSPLGDELPKLSHVFIIDNINLIRAIRAYAFFAAAAPFLYHI